VNSSHFSSEQQHFSFTILYYTNEKLTKHKLLIHRSQ